MPLFSVFELYVAALKDSPLSPKSTANLRSHVKQFLTWLAHRIEREPTGEDFTSIQVRAYLTEKGLTLAPGSLYQYDAALRNFGTWLTEEGYLLASPLDRVARPENVRGRRPLPSPEVIDKLRDVGRLIFDDYRRALSNTVITLMMDCGLRPGEVLGLTVADYDRKTQMLTIRRAKGNKGRVIPLPSYADGCLRLFLSLRPKDCKHNLLLALNRGLSLGRDGLLKLLQERLHLAGHSEEENGHVTPHALRHIAATKLLKSGATLKEIMEILGHVSLSSTQVYLEATEEDLRNALERATERMKEALPEPPRAKRRFQVERRRF